MIDVAFIQQCANPGLTPPTVPVPRPSTPDEANGPDPAACRQGRRARLA
ncbi:hypothetical protein [Mesorhizobium sp.]|nr:hypothetical protein [Mesorhizobium sp.]